MRPRLAPIVIDVVNMGAQMKHASAVGRTLAADCAAIQNVTCLKGSPHQAANRCST